MNSYGNKKWKMFGRSFKSVVLKCLSTSVSDINVPELVRCNQLIYTTNSYCL